MEVRENVGEGTGKKKHKCWVQNRQGQFKIVWEMRSHRLICMIHGHELSGGTREGKGLQEIGG